VIPIYDPLTNGTQQFVGNVIPKSRFSPTAPLTRRRPGSTSTPAL